MALEIKLIKIFKAQILISDTQLDSGMCLLYALVSL